MSEGGREAFHWIIKATSQSKMSNLGWEELNRLVETAISFKCEMSDGGWEVIHGMRKRKSKCEMSDISRKVIHWTRKMKTKSKMSDLRW